MAGTTSTGTQDTQPKSSVFDVLRGDKPALLEISIDTTSIIWLGVTVMAAVLLGVVAAQFINKQI